MARAKRPLSIRWFERLFYFGLTVAALNTWAVGAYVDVHADLGEAELGFMVMSLLATTALNLLFLWLIAYRGSNIARWIFIGLVVLGMLSVVADARHARTFGDVSLALTIIQSLCCAIEILLLFRRDSRDWFAGVRPVDPEIFR